MKYVAKAHLTNEGLGINVFPGEEVPESLVKMSPWVLDEGLVVTAKQHQQEQAAQQAQESTVAVVMDQDDPEQPDAASSGTEEG